MCRTTISALLSAVVLFAALRGLSAQAAGAAGSTTAGAATATASAGASKDTAAWVLGITRFLPVGPGDEHSILLSALPRLMAADLKSLPVRRPPDEDVAEAARLNSLRARFLAGTDLAAKLDARAMGFFDPSLDGAARKYGIITADKGVSDSAKKLGEALLEKKAPVHPQSTTLVAKLWSGHSGGQLIDPPESGPAKAAKAAAVDFLVSGSIALESGYAKVVVRGYDVSLGREVFSWKAFCSADDPMPVAEDMANRLERWTAGREFSRVELKPDPTSAELRVNGELLADGSRIAYIFHDGPINISATASGYSPLSTTVDIALGERLSQELKLQPLSTGSVSLKTSPPDASISIDSELKGQSPLTIGLDGSRPIVTVTAKGSENQTVVLPASGDSDIAINLQPSDGLGPSGRIAAAKDKFYSRLGWFILSIPISALTYGSYKEYDNAYTRSGSTSDSLGNSRNTAAVALGVAAAATATTAVFMVIRLVKYLKTAH